MKALYVKLQNTILNNEETAILENVKNEKREENVLKQKATVENGRETSPGQGQSQEKQVGEYDKYISLDISEWPEKKDLEFESFWLEIGCSKIQNCDAKILKEHSFIQKDCKKHNRKCNVSMFFWEIKNGERIKRNWLCFSVKSGQLYCFYCKVFDCSGSSFIHGLCDWKN